MPGPADAPKTTAKDGDVIVVDLGKKKEKSIKLLRKGKGKLMDQVKLCLEELKASGTIGSNAQPVVIIVEEEAMAWDFMRMMKG